MFATILYGLWIMEYGLGNIEYGLNFKTSDSIISTLPDPWNVFLRMLIKRWSFSSAITRLAFFLNSSVRKPFPGPISTMRSLFVILAAFKIFWITPAFTKKFCPNDFLAFNIFSKTLYPHNRHQS